MIELCLDAGPVVAFDGRILEIFQTTGGSSRFHVTQLDDPESFVGDDGTRSLSFAGGSLTLKFAREEAPACERLLAAIAAARA